jgi:hypothetical protein
MFLVVMNSNVFQQICDKAKSWWSSLTAPTTIVIRLAQPSSAELLEQAKSLLLSVVGEWEKFAAGGFLEEDADDVPFWEHETSPASVLPGPEENIEDSADEWQPDQDAKGEDAEWKSNEDAFTTNLTSINTSLETLIGLARSLQRTELHELAEAVLELALVLAQMRRFFAEMEHSVKTIKPEFVTIPEYNDRKREVLAKQLLEACKKYRRAVEVAAAVCELFPESEKAGD